MNKKAFFISITILSALTLGACGGSSGGGGIAPGNGAGKTINSSGGTGGNNGGAGSNASEITIQKNGGDGPIEVLTTGSVDTSFNIPPYTPIFGTNLLEISGTVEVELDPAVGITLGLPYIETADAVDVIRISDGNGVLGDEPAVTGIKINDGGRLVLPLNDSLTARINLTADVDNNGTITTLDDSPTRRGRLELNLENYYATGNIETFGNLEGQDGGRVFINALGMIINSGDITSNGFNSNGNGGDGGLISLDANLELYNTGTISASGGHSATVYGGDGDTITLASQYGKIYNSGNIFSNGGNGAIGGGTSDRTRLYANNNGLVGIGGIVNSGRIENISGNATQSGDGGSDGGTLTLRTFGGGIKSSGDLLAYGGDTVDVAGDGGNSNLISIESRAGFLGLNPVAAGSIELSGNLHAYAGSAPASGTGSGGVSGAITISLDASREIFFPALPGPVSIPPVKLGLYGYSQILAQGGVGNTGGSGAPITIEDVGRRWDGGLAAYQGVGGGDVNVAVAISSQGGSVPVNSVMLPALGGSGDTISITSMSNNLDRPYVVTSTGNIDNSGGDSRELAVDPNASNAGSISVMTLFGETTVDGVLTANGGSDTGATGYGYNGGFVSVAAFQVGNPTLNATLNANGGDGATTGGDGGLVGGGAFYGTAISNGVLNARGGSANATTGTGGAGGTANWNVNSGTCTDNGTVNVSGGSGNTPGAAGTDNTC